MARFLIGCDPEFMIVDGNGKLKSALKIFKGRKHEPEKLSDGASLADNVNFEFNTNPASSPNEFKKYIKSVLQESARSLPARHRFVAISGADFPKSELRDKEACEFGCEPDYNAWNDGQANIVPEGAAERTFRSAGGHIHIGYTEDTKDILTEFDDKLRMIRLMDATVGIVSTFLDKTDGSEVRRSLYGKAGCFRPKGYGVEYRTVGNYWAANPKTVDLIYGLVNAAVELRLKGDDIKLIENLIPQRIIDTINSSDNNTAHTLYQEFLVPVLDKDTSATINKLAKSLKNVGDIHNNWKLSQEV